MTTYYGLTDKTDSLKSGNFQVRIRVIVDEAQENFNEILPFALWQFHSCDSSDHLRREGASFL